VECGKLNKKFKQKKLQFAKARASHILANCNFPLNLSVKFAEQARRMSPSHQHANLTVGALLDKNPVLFYC
jgi:hypothetical protein